MRLTVIHPAQIPGAPITPNKVLNIGLGFVVGLLIGIGIVVLRDVLDNTVKSPSDYEDAGVPAMGVVPFDKRTASEPIAFRVDGTSARSEAYRQIRTNLQFVDVDNPPRIISVTSAMPGEGKSTTALNLAAALAEAGSRVCLIEADLRRPSLAKSLGLVGDVGFTTALIGKTPVEDVLQNAGQNLAVLTSGPIPPNPSELLITEHARAIIQRVASHVDFVVIDTPPLLPVTDGATVATLADATLIVSRAGRTTHEQAHRSIEALDKVGRHPVGVVMNMVTRGRGGYSYEYGYYYTDRERTKLGRTDVGVGAGKSTPDAADDSSLDLLTPETDTDGPYRPVHAPDSGRPAPTPSPARVAETAARPATARVAARRRHHRRAADRLARRRRRAGTAHLGTGRSRLGRRPDARAVRALPARTQRRGAEDAGWSRAINGEQQSPAWSPPSAPPAPPIGGQRRGQRRYRGDGRGRRDPFDGRGDGLPAFLTSSGAVSSGAAEPGAPTNPSEAITAFTASLTAAAEARTTSIGAPNGSPMSSAPGRSGAGVTPRAAATSRTRSASDAGVAPDCGELPALRRANSRRVKVWRKASGDSLSRAARCPESAVSTSEAPSTRAGVTRRAVWPSGFPPSSRRTRADGASMGYPVSPFVPALAARTGTPWGSRARNRRSAMGDRQIFPVHTNSTSKVTRSGCHP